MLLHLCEGHKNSRADTAQEDDPGAQKHASITDLHPIETPNDGSRGGLDRFVPASIVGERGGVVGQSAHEPVDVCLKDAVVDGVEDVEREIAEVTPLGAATRQCLYPSRRSLSWNLHIYQRSWTMAPYRIFGKLPASAPDTNRCSEEKHESDFGSCATAHVL